LDLSFLFCFSEFNLVAGLVFTVATSMVVSTAVHHFVLLKVVQFSHILCSLLWCWCVLFLCCCCALFFIFLARTKLDPCSLVAIAYWGCITLIFLLPNLLRSAVVLLLMSLRCHRHFVTLSQLSFMPVVFRHRELWYVRIYLCW
jgi:hypothetical protein